MPIETQILVNLVLVDEDNHVVASSTKVLKLGIEKKGENEIQLVVMGQDRLKAWRAGLRPGLVKASTNQLIYSWERISTDGGQYLSIYGERHSEETPQD